MKTCRAWAQLHERQVGYTWIYLTSQCEQDKFAGKSGIIAGKSPKNESKVEP